MRCPACQAEVQPGQQFCGTCGTKVDASNDLTVTSDATRLVGSPAAARTEAGATSTSGWLSSSGSIDHGRFGPGMVLDTRYRIIGLLGKGGMGEVYRADDLRLGQPVALKFLPQLLAADGKRLAQLHNEVRMARQVSHANVCRVYDVGDVEGQLFLTMEYVDGEDLAASLKRVGRFPEDRAIEIARQICAGLASAHDRGIIHRDLKPANIMIDGDGRVRIMDFGLAAAGDVENVRVGTPAYMAPEQLEGREVTTKSDIYALGLVLYELFTGRRAFTATSVADLVQQQTSGDLTAPTEIVKGLDPAIEAAIERCLERDPARRSATVLDVARALPGGDPIAAALAAGETPSPAMVAAAGGEAATLTPRTGMTWLGVAAVLAVLVTTLGDRVSLVARIPLVRPPAVLADKAEELRQAFGYNEPVVDQAYGFITDGEYLAWADRHGSGALRWPQLVEGRPAPMQFWYRTSPRLLLPIDPAGSRNLADPPFGGVTGMTIVRLDLQGRLLRFEAMPRQIDPDEVMPASTVDWADILTKAGLDPAAFEEVTPGRTPRSFADARHAFRGPLAGTDLTVTVETASYRGRPVYFEIIGPWTSAPRDPGAEPGNAGGSGTGQVILILLLLGIAAVLTHANLKSGRADRRGAFRLAGFLFFLSLSMWALSPHMRSLVAERTRFFTSIAFSLFLGGAMYVIYLAIEPYVRRGWPTALVGWSRLLSGKIRDPFVGRDLLIGVGCGMAIALLDRLDRIVPVALGWPEPNPAGALASNALLGLRPFAAAILNQINEAIQEGLLTVLVIALVRVSAQRLMARFKIQRVSVDVVIATIAVIVVGLATLNSHASELQRAWLPILTAETMLLIILFLIYRIGMLSAVFAFSAYYLITRLPITFDGSRFYAGPGWAVLLVIVLLAALGFRWARANEPLFGEPSTRNEAVGQ